MSVRTLCALLPPLWLAGCANLGPEQAYGPATGPLKTYFDAGVPALDDAARQRAAEQARAVLARGPLAPDDAVRVALWQSPALQAMLAESWSKQAQSLRGGLPPSPRIMLERMTHDGEVEISRALALPLLDLLMWPLRHRAAEAMRQSQALQAAQSLLQACFAVRAQWAQAVAANQVVALREQVHDSAMASAELGRRMQAAGNFSRLQAAREQLQELQARMALAQARQDALAARESLVRAMGLASEQAALLRLPERLPDADAPAPAMDHRLDLALARAEVSRLQGAAGAQALAPFDLELALHREGSARGVELELALPVPDTGSLGRSARSAELAAAQARLEAVQREADSLLRERRAALATTQAVERSAREEGLPLARRVMDENLLRYNGMLIGVFELLADSRAQVAMGMTAIEAQLNRVLARNALDAALAGVDAAAARRSASPAAAPAAADAH